MFFAFYYLSKDVQSGVSFVSCKNMLLLLHTMIHDWRLKVLVEGGTGRNEHNCLSFQVLRIALQSQPSCLVQHVVDAPLLKSFLRTLLAGQITRKRRCQITNRQAFPVLAKELFAVIRSSFATEILC